MRISYYTKKCIFFLIKLDYYLVILDIKWLQIYNISIKWALNIAIFNNLYYKKNYLFKEQIIIILDIINMPKLFEV